MFLKLQLRKTLTKPSNNEIDVYSSVLFLQGVLLIQPVPQPAACKPETLCAFLLRAGGAVCMPTRSHAYISSDISALSLVLFLRLNDLPHVDLRFVSTMNVRRSMSN